jgi:hypothetical protein
MQQTTDIVSPPTIDGAGYISNFLTYIVDHLPIVIDFIKSIVGVFVGISFVLSLMLFIGIIYCVEKLKLIRKKEEEIYNPKIEIAYEEVVKGDPDLARRWDKVKNHIESDNENDWRQAIMEADIMLAELLTKMGYKGEGIGEQLKRVEKSDFNTLDEAWEAHKVRNRIAHDGSGYVLSKTEAKRTIDLYRKVFDEFYFI